MKLGKIGNSKMLWTPSAKDYVKDGLIAMWDGIENAGWGVHDGRATTWKDLVGNRDMMIGSTGVFLSNCLQSSGAASAVLASPIYRLLYTEVVMQFTDNSAPSQGVLLINSEGWRFGIQKLTSGLGIAPGYSNDGNRAHAYPKDTPFAFSVKRTSSLRQAGVSFNGVIDDGWNYGYGGNAGSQTYGVSYYTDRPFKGCIFSIRAYSRAMTGDEIAANYAIDKARFKLP